VRLLFYTRNSSQAVFIRHVGENLYYCFSNGYWIPSLPITMESADLIRNLKHPSRWLPPLELANGLPVPAAPSWHGPNR
jgi:hypothetical protein